MAERDSGINLDLKASAEIFASKVAKFWEDSGSGYAASAKDRCSRMVEVLRGDTRSTNGSVDVNFLSKIWTLVLTLLLSYKRTLQRALSDSYETSLWHFLKEIWLFLSNWTIRTFNFKFLGDRFVRAFPSLNTLNIEKNSAMNGSTPKGPKSTEQIVEGGAYVGDGPHPNVAADAEQHVGPEVQIQHSEHEQQPRSRQQVEEEPQQTEKKPQKGSQQESEHLHKEVCVQASSSQEHGKHSMEKEDSNTDEDSQDEGSGDCATSECEKGESSSKSDSGDTLVDLMTKVYEEEKSGYKSEDDPDYVPSQESDSSDTNSFVEATELAELKKDLTKAIGEFLPQDMKDSKLYPGLDN